MNIEKKIDGKSMTIFLEGRLDTTTAPELEDELKDSLGGITSLDFDFAKLEYISSAGLRILLSTQKVMNKQGQMTIRGVNDIVQEVFDMTGFSDILHIEK